MEIRERQLECPTCGVAFTVSFALAKRHEASGDAITCPNGHPFSVCAGDDVTGMKAELQHMTERRDYWRELSYERRDGLDARDRRIAALRGQITKLRKRIEAMKGLGHE